MSNKIKNFKSFIINESFNQKKSNEFESWLLDRTDGPVSSFVVIAREIDYARKPQFKKFSNEEISNALESALSTLTKSGGSLSSSEFE